MHGGQDAERRRKERGKERGMEMERVMDGQGDIQEDWFALVLLHSFMHAALAQAQGGRAGGGGVGRAHGQ